MTLLKEILRTLDNIAPLESAESWDNVGLLLGDSAAKVTRVMTCLTVTPETVAEAIELRAELIVSHHPIPFKPVSRVTDETLTGRLLLECAKHGIAIYSPHTAWDNAQEGINAQLAKILLLEDVGALTPNESVQGEAAKGACAGQGRMGSYAVPLSLGELKSRVCSSIPDVQWRSTHREDHTVSVVGILCGSGGGYWREAERRKCDALLTGEATYHQCLEAEANGIALLMLGHFASEAFSMKKLAAMIAASHVGLIAEASQRERSSF